jgi:uncharacterized LabA/DUF88 family protein
MQHCENVCKRSSFNYKSAALPAVLMAQVGSGPVTMARRRLLIPNLTVYFGSFLATKVRMRRADGRGFVHVLKSEEKGSDVNLTSHLLIDCYLSDCDVAVIFSNDSDLVFPIEHVKQHLGKIIGIVNPHRRPSRELLGVANFYKSIRPAVLAQCHFPDRMSDAQGEFHKPPTW